LTIITIKVTQVDCLIQWT